MEKSEKLLLRKVSFQHSAWAPIDKEISIGETLEDIKNNKYQPLINNLRRFLADGDKEKYDSHKKKLPGVTFCGTFEGKRKREFLKNYNELVVIDIDKLDDERLLEIKNVLRNDKHVFSFWESPSQRGMKGLVKLQFDTDYKELGVDVVHKHAFSKLVEYFATHYNIHLDESGSDTTRLCFLSSDKSLILKGTYASFEINEIEVSARYQKGKQENGKALIRKVGKRDALNNPEGKNSAGNRATIQSIIKYLSKRNLSITGNYDNWYRVAYAIADSFTYDIGEKYYLKLCRLDGDKHEDIESRNMLTYCYEHTTGDISFSTIYHLAQELGYKSKKGGSP